MNAEPLSQEQIDALMRQQQNGMEEEPIIIPPEEREAVENYATVIAKAMSNVLSTFTGRDIAVDYTDVDEVTAHSLNDNLVPRNAIVFIEYTEGLEGGTAFFIGEEDAVTLVSLFDVDSSSEKLTEVGESTVGEIFNNTFGNANQSLQMQLGYDVSNQVPIVEVLNVADEDFQRYASLAGERSLLINYNIAVGEEIELNFVQILPNNIVDALMTGQVESPTLAAQNGEDLDLPGLSATRESTKIDQPSVRTGQTDRQTGRKEASKEAVPQPQPAVFEPLSTGGVVAPPSNLELLMDVLLEVKVELGRSELKIKDILELGPGSVVELNKLAGEPVDLFANDKLIAKGEVVVIDENFGIRITEILNIPERLDSIRGH